MSMPKGKESVYLSADRQAEIKTIAPGKYRSAERVAFVPVRSKGKAKTCALNANDAASLARALMSTDALSELADNLKRAAYYGEIRDTAASIIEDLRDGNIADAEDLDTRIHETADSAMTYTRDVMDCIRYSDNDGAYVEDFGEDGLIKDGDVNWPAIGYAAYARDLRAQIEAEDVDVSSPWKCPECDETFDSFEAHKDHISTCGKTECDECGALIPDRLPTVNNVHADTCTLHPHNVVNGADTKGDN